MSAVSDKGQPKPSQPDGSAVKSYDERLNAAKKEVMDRAIQNASERVKSVADERLRSVDAAEKGIGVPYGDYWNRRAFDEASQRADLLTHDMQVAKELMSQGDTITKNTRAGMGGSMRTWGGGQ